MASHAARNSNRTGLNLLAAVCAAAAQMGSAAVVAQAPAGAALERAEVEEIIVTARRRAETLRQYAGTASVFNADALEEARVDGLEDIVNRVPNAYFEDRPGSQINIFIRGAGTATNGSATQTDAAIGLYMDGIYSYLQGSRIPLVFYDMDRIEVFRGPQGSLYGRNAVGGAVAAYTARPKHEFESYVSLQRAEYNSTTAEGRLNVPLGDAFALRLSGYYDDIDSQYTNLDPNHEDAGSRAASGRIRLRYEPNDALDIVFGYERLDEDKGPQIIVPERFAVAERLISVSDTDSHVERTTDRILATVDWDLAPGIALRALSGYTQIDSNGMFDQNNLQTGPGPAFLPFIGIQADERDGSQLTHELVLTSTGEGPLEWLVGASYFEDEQEGGARIQSGLLGSAVGVVSSRSSFESSTEMWAAFVDVSWRFWEKVVLGGSLRYSDELRKARRSNATIIDPATGLPFPAGAFQFKDQYSRLSPGGSLSVLWSDDFMTYAKVATAYQSGGINTRPRTIDDAVFGPSTAINYELGFKSSLPNKALLLNVSVFRMFQDDYQYQVQDPPFNDFRNAGEARTDGVEVELVLRPADWLSIPFSYGYLDARLTKLTNPRAGTVQGQPLFGIPKNTATAGIDIDLPLPGWGTDTSLYLRANYLMTRNRYLPAASAVQLDDYEVVDFKTGVRFGKRYEIYAFGENVTDSVHVITPAAGGRIFSPLGLFGAGFTAKF